MIPSSANSGSERTDARVAASAALVAGQNRRFRAARDSFAAFVRLLWKEVEPVTLEWGRHMQVVCDAFQSMVTGGVRRLLINIPPGFSKSLICGVLLPGWIWLRDPTKRMWFLSCAEKVVTRDADRFRSLIRSELYKEMLTWSGADWSLRIDNIDKIQNSRHGFRASGVLGGKLIGSRADWIFVDDPHDIADVTRGAPETITAKVSAVCSHFDQVLSTRLNDQRTGRVGIIMQRVHEIDLSAHVKRNPPSAHDYYERVCLPMHFDPVEADPRDWRKVLGELLDPIRFPDDVVQTLERQLGHQASGQLEQRPVSPTGGALPLKGWKWLNPKDPLWPSSFERTGSGWDLAFGASKAGAYHAGVFGGYARGKVYLLDVVRVRCSIDILMERMDAARSKHPAIISWRVEDAAAFRGLKETLLRGITFGDGRKIKPFSNLIPVSATGRGDKVALMQAWQPYQAAGNIVLPCTCSIVGLHHHDTPEELCAEQWAVDFVNEGAQFPLGRYKDQIDAAGQFLPEMFAESSIPIAVPLGASQVANW